MMPVHRMRSEKSTKNQKEKLEKWNMEIIISNKIQNTKCKGEKR